MSGSVSTPVQIRDALLARLTATPGLGAQLGVVHAFERYASSLGDLALLYQPAGSTELRGWFLRRVTARPVVASNLHLEVESLWRLHGYLTLDDAAASELTMQGLVDAVMVDLWADGDETLGGLLVNLGPRGGERPGTPWGWELVDFQQVQFAGVLCHGVTLELTTTHAQARGVEPDDFLRGTAGWQLDTHPDPDAVDEFELEQA